MIPLALAKEFGADALLSYLLRHIPSTGDADFSRGRCPQAYESELGGAAKNSKNLPLYVCWIAESSQFPPLRRLKVHSSVVSCG